MDGGMKTSQRRDSTSGRPLAAAPAGRRASGGSGLERSRKFSMSSVRSKRESQPEVGQVSRLIGDFGRYQFFIFAFKILIGIVSPFNNLGMTFHAPTGFVAHWCADTTSLMPANASILQLQQPQLQAHLQRFTPRNQDSNRSTPAASTTNYNIRTSPNHNYVSGKPHTTKINEILSEFLSSPERDLMSSMSFDYDTPRGLRRECAHKPAGAQQPVRCSAYQYDTGIWISTIIDEWDLVCERSWYVSMLQSLYMSSFILAFILVGYFSDRYGRWRCLMGGASIEMLGGFGCAFSPSVGWYMIFRFMLGIGNAGRTTSSYLVMIEWAGPKSGVYVSTYGVLGWIIGYSVMPWVTLHFLHFRHMHLFTSCYEAIMIACLFALPESPRWLLTHKRYDRAYKVLLRAARWNGLIIEGDKEGDQSASATKSSLELPNASDSSIDYINKLPRPLVRLRHEQNLLRQPPRVKLSQNGQNDVEIELPTDNQKLSSPVEHGSWRSIDEPLRVQDNDADSPAVEPYTLAEFNSRFKRLVDTIEAKEFTKNEDNLTMLDLFKWPNIRCWTLILCFIWAANSFIYYGISLRVGDFGAKNLFVAFTIAGLIEIPSIWLTIIFLRYMPRGVSNTLINLLQGGMCFMQIPLMYYGHEWLQPSTIILAKLLNSGAFTIVLYHTMEIFPTSIRQTAYSECSLAGRIGSILAPFAKELSQVTNQYVVVSIYSAIALIAALLCRLLPETRGKDLPDTMLEAEKTNEKAADS